MILHRNCGTIPFVAKSSITILTSFVLTTGVKAIGESRVQAVEDERETVTFYCPECETNFTKDAVSVRCDHCGGTDNSIDHFVHLKNILLTVCLDCQRLYFPDEPSVKLTTVLNKVIRR